MCLYYSDAEAQQTRTRAIAIVGAPHGGQLPASCPNGDHAKSATGTAQGTNKHACTTAKSNARKALENTVNVHCWDYITVGGCTTY